MSSTREHRKHKTRKESVAKYQYDEDEDETISDIAGVTMVQEYDRHHSVHSNASSDGQPPVAVQGTWIDRLSSTSDANDDVNGDYPQPKQSKVRSAWGSGKGKSENKEKDRRDPRKPVKGSQGLNNLSFDNEEEKAAISQINSGIVGNIKTAEGVLSQWREYREKVQVNSDEIQEEIEKRRQDTLVMVEQLFQELASQAGDMTDAKLQRSTTVIKGLRKTIKEMKQTAKDNFTSESVATIGLKGTKQQLESICRQFDHHNKETPSFERLTLSRIENPMQVARSLAGEIHGFAADGLLTGQLDSGKVSPDEESLMTLPELQGSFSSKTSKDGRECGVTDVAVISTDEVAVVDKHNKLVKIFNMKGTFLRFIGRHYVKEPCRVSVLSASKHILVSDLASKCVKIFNSDGKYTGEFASDLKFPLCHKEMYDGNIAILEYSTKFVIIYDSSLKQLHMFDTEMSFPAYMCCTKNNNIAVSDWKKNRVKIFDNRGNLIKNIQGPGNQEGNIDAPQGLCSDRFGHLFIAEKGNRRVQVFTEYGEFLKCYHTDANKFKIPWALACNAYDLLVIAEYQGAVKVVKYMELPFSEMVSMGDVGGSRDSLNDRHVITRRKTSQIDTQC